MSPIRRFRRPSTKTVEPVPDGYAQSHLQIACSHHRRRHCRRDRAAVVAVGRRWPSSWPSSLSSSWAAWATSSLVVGGSVVAIVVVVVVVVATGDGHGSLSSPMAKKKVMAMGHWLSPMA